MGTILCMYANAIRSLLEIKPFETVEVELSSGQVFIIRQPETTMVLKNTLVVTEPETDTVQWTSLINVVGVRRRQVELPPSA